MTQSVEEARQYDYCLKVCNLPCVGWDACAIVKRKGLNRSGSAEEQSLFS